MYAKGRETGEGHAENGILAIIPTNTADASITFNLSWKLRNH